jgi:phospholipase C
MNGQADAHSATFEKDVEQIDEPRSVELGSPNLTRRRILSDAARLAAAAFTASFLPSVVRRELEAAQAGVPPAASLKQIKHVVLMMQENRSFDHYFGTMAGVRGFSDPHALKLEHGKSVFHQPDPKSPGGYLVPFHLDTQKSQAQRIPATNNGWGVLHSSWNGGKMNNWLGSHRQTDKGNAPFVMGYYKRGDIPFQFALAEAFTVCDAYFASVLGPTWPNRMYWMTGTLDASGHHGGPLIDNIESKKGFTWTTYAERLQKAGVSWKLYHQKDEFGTNLFWQFKSFRDSHPKSDLFRHGLTAGPSDQFERDVKHDRLPTVSWILPNGEACEHPDHWPAAGAELVARKIEALAANPDVWNKTVFILNYDENDGLFDHVVPPTAPPHTPGEYVQGVPIGAGFRVPCVVISPWTAGGWVSNEWFDHTSVLRFLEKVTGVREPNITGWRRKTFGDMTSVFRFKNKQGEFPKLPNAHHLLAKAQHEFKHLPKASPHLGAGSMPVQEKERP